MRKQIEPSDFWPKFQPISKRSHSPSPKIDKLLGKIMRMKIYASLRLSTNTLRKTDMAIIVMILTSSSAECSRTLKAHSEDCGIMGKQEMRDVRLTQV